MAQPEAYIGGADKLFDADGKLANEGTRKFLENFMQAYASWINEQQTIAATVETQRRQEMMIAQRVLILFLTSDAGKSISGQVLPIDNDRRASA